MMTEARIDLLRRSFSRQAVTSGKLGSNLYQSLFTGLAEATGTGGTADRIMAEFDGDIASDFPALRWAGGLHRAALDGRAPGLARHYPSCGGSPDFDRLWEDADRTQAGMIDELIAFMKSPPQTNEVQRSVVLIPGLHWIAQQLGPDMELLEIGASAGLNQNLDRMAVQYSGQRLGPDDADLALTADNRGATLPDAPFRITARAACDLSPIDATSAEGALRLQSYIWPDQIDRLDRLRTAIRLAERHKPKIDAASAAEWLADRTTRPQAASIRVVMHSYMWPYLPQAERHAVTNVLTAAGAAAKPGRAFVHLAMEDDDDHRRHYLTARIWPGDETHVLAQAGPHGQWLNWAPVRA